MRFSSHFCLSPISRKFKVRFPPRRQRKWGKTNAFLSKNRLLAREPRPKSKIRRKSDDFRATSHFRNSRRKCAIFCNVARFAVTAAGVQKICTDPSSCRFAHSHSAPFVAEREEKKELVGGSFTPNVQKLNEPSDFCAIKQLSAASKIGRKQKPFPPPPSPFPFPFSSLFLLLRPRFAEPNFASRFC